MGCKLKALTAAMTLCGCKHRGRGPRLSRRMAASQALLLLLCLPLLAQAHFGSVREEDLGSSSTGGAAGSASSTARAQVTEDQPDETESINPIPLRFQGVYVVRTVSLTNGGDVLAHLLRTQDSGLLEMDIEAVADRFELVAPGKSVEVVGMKSGTHKIRVKEVSLTSSSSTAVTTKSASDMDINMEEEISDGFAELGGTKVQVAWTQSRTVGDMSVLFIISSICGQPAATTVSDLEKVVFAGPGSKAKTLEAYYKECSYGLTNMNSSNSKVKVNGLTDVAPHNKVVGPVNIPCTYTGEDFTFDANMCAFADADGWMKYAVALVQPLYGVDPTQYRHRVLLLPPYYIYQAGCRWVGLGTLGPDATGPEGDYLYSSVWLTGDFWRHVAAYMHELGHTNYLHHSAQGTCVYCDMSCVMGDCCDTRCFNPVHNWQLGWGKPITILNGESVPVGQTMSFTLPTQQSSRTHMLVILPDWIPNYGKQNLRGFGIFLGYRTDTGKYDDDMPAEYLYATNVYTFDGQSQFICRYSWLWASVGTGQEFRNTTWQLSIKQLQGTNEAALITVCRWNEAQETSCSDGIDNDCDGLVDALDPDCIQPGLVNDVPINMNPPRPPRPTSPPPAAPSDGSARPPMPPSPMAPATPKAPKKWGKKWGKNKWKKKPPPPPPLEDDGPSPPPPKKKSNPKKPGKKWGNKQAGPSPPNLPSPPIPKKWLWKYRPRPPPPYSAPGSPLLDLFAHLGLSRTAAAVQGDIPLVETEVGSPVPAGQADTAQPGAGGPVEAATVVVESRTGGDDDNDRGEAADVYDKDYYVSDVPDYEGYVEEMSDDEESSGEEGSSWDLLTVEEEESSGVVDEEASPSPSPSPSPPQPPSPPSPAPPYPPPVVGSVREGDRGGVKEGEHTGRRLVEGGDAGGGGGGATVQQAQAGDEAGRVVEAGSKYVEDDWHVRQHQPERKLSESADAATVGEEVTGSSQAEVAGSTQQAATAATQQLKYKWKDASEDDLWKQIEDAHRTATDTDDETYKVAALGMEDDGLEAGRLQAVQRWAAAIAETAEHQMAAVTEPGEDQGRSLLQTGQAVLETKSEAGVDMSLLHKHALAIGGEFRDDTLRYRFKLVHGSKSPQEGADK